ncbi:ribose ABC transporter ATP-binding protein [Rhodopirellula maiorica SM1]|uniref:Ribose ABC transporter ATP-binding protein n=1 Tax=Rhodopirellula maiorica SM1 TaxID=1265738 RepID=M5RBJ3_9BACT|nr:sugar ABC transporter ATP-binding protein [Rhodopirellula maiorica]EMI16750.1 ribose ABC transporter ATP-binding protein [Rhodopirellula maiorica SM1]
MNSLLQVDGLTKRYGSVTVLRDVSLEVRAGEIHALLGANGAGKSTLCKIISGLVPRSDGEMTLGGHAFDPSNKQVAERHGVEIVQQELNLIPTLSVAENLLLTRLPRRFGAIDSRKLHRTASQILDRFGLADVATDALVGSLGVGRQQMVEIAAALARECKLLILDEPTAALSGSESEQLFGHLTQLRDEGVAIIYISHRLDEVARLSDRVTVLRDGALVGTHSTSSLTTDAMVDLMSGEATSSAKRDHVCHTTGETAMRVDSMTSGIVQDVSFTVQRGERLGITGLVGSGRTELLRAIFGADVATDGHVYLGADSLGNKAAPRRFRHPSEAVAAGLAMVTEDRKQDGLLLTQSIRINTTLSSMWRRFSRVGLTREAEENRVATAMRESLATRCESIDQFVGTLSGGNQQKVAVAKWLVRDADVFLFDEPTRGIDAGARQRIYQLFETLSIQGKAIVVVSSDLEELFETCDRIAVMSAGRMVDSFDRNEWSEEKIMQASFRGYKDRISEPVND